MNNRTHNRQRPARAPIQAVHVHVHYHVDSDEDGGIGNKRQRKGRGRPRAAECEECEGRGWECDGFGSYECGACDGTGKAK